MTRKHLFAAYAVTSFLVTLQVGVSKEIRNAQIDAKSAIRRKQQQQAIERVLHDLGI